AEGGVVASHTAGERSGGSEGAVRPVDDLERARDRALSVLPGTDAPPAPRRRIDWSCFAPLAYIRKRVAEGGVVASHTAGERSGGGEGAVRPVADLERARERALSVLPGAEAPPGPRRRVRCRGRG